MLAKMYYLNNLNEGFDLINVSEMFYLNCFSGYLLLRYPSNILSCLDTMKNEKYRESYLSSTGCTILFEKCKAKKISIKVCSMFGKSNARIYKNGEVYANIEISQMEIEIDLIDESRDIFMENQWKIVFGKGSGIIIRNILCLLLYNHFGTDKQKKWLSYGSSITHGSGANFVDDSYSHRVASYFGYEMYNKSVSGCSFLEESIVKFICLQNEFDVLLFEIGLNMLGKFSLPDLKSRIDYLFSCLSKSTSKNIIVISPILCLYMQNGHPKRADWFEITDYLECKVKNSIRNILFIKGENIVKSLDYLGQDLLHPTNKGHQLMSENLLDIIMKYEEWK